MGDSELVLLAAKTIILFIATYVIISGIGRIIAITKAKTAQFFVKIAFGFERKDCLIGSLIYYNESDVMKQLTENKVDLYDYVVNFAPNFNLPIEPVPLNAVRSASMATRLSVKKELIDKYKTLIIVNKRCVVIINRMGVDPRNSWWFGTALYSNNEDVIKTVAYKIGRARKHDTACHVVRT